MKAAVIVDSTAYLSEALAQHIKLPCRLISAMAQL